MAQYKSVITKEGGKRLAEIIGSDGILTITSAAAGDGRPLGEPEDRTALVNPLEVHCTVGEKTFLPGEPSQVKIPIQVDNLGLSQPAAIREIGVFATYAGREFLLAYSYLVGEDSDNLMNPSLSTQYADTIHAHDLMLIVTSAQNAHLTVEVSMEGSVTLGQLKEYTYSRSEADQKISQEIKTAKETILEEVDTAISQAGEELLGTIREEAVSQVGTLILPAAAWQQDPVSQLYAQPVSIPGLTADSKVDFDTDVATMAELPAAIQPVNDNGTLTAVTLEPPQTDIQVQVTVIKTEALAIQTAPTIVTQLINPVPIANEAYAFTFGAAGNMPFTWELTGGSLPDGLSLSSTGVLSGTPAAETGLASFTVKVSNAYGEDTRTFTISVAGPSGIAVSDLPNGTLVQMQEGGSSVLFYKAVSDYESDLNGAGRCLMLRKDVGNTRQWNDSNMDTYAESAIDGWMNGEYKALFSEKMQEMMGTTKFYYTPGNGNTTVTTLGRSVFLPSLAELGKTVSYANVEGVALPVADMLQIAYLDGSPIDQWTRTTSNDGQNGIVFINYQGLPYRNPATNTYAPRPCFTLPGTAMVHQTPNPDGSYTLIE